MDVENLLFKGILNNCSFSEVYFDYIFRKIVIEKEYLKFELSKKYTSFWHLKIYFKRKKVYFNYSEK
jgi:hypothetical protein